MAELQTDCLRHISTAISQFLFFECENLRNSLGNKFPNRKELLGKLHLWLNRGRLSLFGNKSNRED